MSNIKLVIADEIKFPETKNYIRRKFQIVKEDCQNFKALLEKIGNRKVAVIHNGPGIGKSAEMAKIGERLKKKHEKKFPLDFLVLMPLKDFHQSYISNEEEKSDLPIMEDDVIRFICEKILNISGFNAFVFSQLYKDKRVIFLMDGFDEICGKYDKFIIQLFKSIKDSQNMLWISTRDDYLELLTGGNANDLKLCSEDTKSLNAIPIELKPFSKDDMDKYLLESLKDSGFKDENLKKTYSEAINFLNAKVFSYDNPKLIYELLDYWKTIKKQEPKFFTNNNERHIFIAHLARKNVKTEY